MDCVIDEKTLRCVNCNAVFSTTSVRANCRKVPPGLGDYVAAFLSAIGVTKERVEAVVGGPCGCPERQAAMNAAGAKWLHLPPGSTAPAEIDPGTP